MSTLIDLMRHPLIAALAWALIHFVWQGALLGGAAFLLLQIVRPQRAVTRYAVGVATLALMLVACAATYVTVARQEQAARGDAVPLSAVTFAPATATPAAAQQLVAEGNAGGSQPSVAAAPSWRFDPIDANTLSIIVIAWVIGVLMMLVRFVGGWVVARRLATRAAIAVSPAIDAAAHDIAQRLRIRRVVTILESHVVVVPTLVGWLTPVVLLPAAALAGLSPDQLRAILAHELAHVRRHDYLVNLLQSMVETLLFYHPATWWVSAQIRAEREHCCDDLAIEVCGDRLVYASALAELTAIAGHRQLALAATDGSLLNRVRRILGTPRTVQEPAPAWSLLALVLVLAVAAGATGAQGSPTRPEAATAQSLRSSGDAERAKADAQGAQGSPTRPEAAAAQSRRSSADSERAEADAERAKADDIAAQLRAQADWLNAEAARLRAEADRIRRAEAQMREARRPGDTFVPEPPEPPLTPEAPMAALPLEIESPAPVPPVPAVPPAAGTPLAPPAPAALPPGAVPLPLPATPRAPAARPAPPAIPVPAISAPAVPAPPAIPSPKAIPAPAAPPAPQHETKSSTSGNMSWSNNGEKLSVKWTGAFRLSDDETDIASLEDGATFTVSDGAGNRVELRGTGKGIDRRYWKNGARREYEPEGRAFLAAAVDRMIRNTGMFAKERVARYLQRGGPDAVLAQIDRLGDSSYVRRVYYSELLTQAPPSDALLTRVLQRVPNEVRSDYDKSTLLTLAAAQPSMNDTHRVAVARAVTSISGDYDQRRALSAILNVSPLAPPVTTAVLDATASIGSNYDRAQVLVTVAEHGGLSVATAPAFMGLVRTMNSSYDQRRVLTAVSAHSPIADSVGVEAVRATSAMGGDYDRATTLVSLIERGGLTDASSQAFFESAGRLSSSHELSRVLRTVLAQPSTSDPIFEGVLRLAPKISGSYDRANMLVDAASRVRMSAEARQLFLAASKGLGTHDENRVLAALVRGETRR